MRPTPSASSRLLTVYADHLVSHNAEDRAVAGKETRHGLRGGNALAVQTAPAWAAFAKAWEEHPETVKAWSDLHLGHANILKYQPRPWHSVAEQDAALLAAAQAAVQPTDWLLFLGDVAMWKEQAPVAAWLAACPGRKVLVLGNHDVRGRECPQGLEAWAALGFEAVAAAIELPFDKGVLWLTHYPLPEERLPDGVANLHGHVHARSWAGRHVNASVEVNDFKPRPLADLLAPLPPSLRKPPQQSATQGRRGR